MPKNTAKEFFLGHPCIVQPFAEQQIQIISNRHHNNPYPDTASNTPIYVTIVFQSGNMEEIVANLTDTIVYTEVIGLSPHTSKHKQWHPCFLLLTFQGKRNSEA